MFAPYVCILMFSAAAVPTESITLITVNSGHPGFNNSMNVTQKGDVSAETEYKVHPGFNSSMKVILRGDMSEEKENSVMEEATGNTGDNSTEQAVASNITSTEKQEHVITRKIEVITEEDESTEDNADDSSSLNERFVLEFRRRYPLRYVDESELDWWASWFD